jgi:hypothetical protein
MFQLDFRRMLHHHPRRTLSQSLQY